MVQLDDLDGREEPGRLLGEPHEQHGADAEVGRDDHPEVGLGLEPLGDRGELGLVEARRPDDAVDVLVDAEPDVVHDDVGPGEVDDHLGAGVGDVEQPVTLVDHGDELEVVGGVDRLDHLGAHAPAGAEHTDGDERRLLRGRAEACWSGAEVLVVTRSGFPATRPGRKTGAPAQRARGGGAPGCPGQRDRAASPTTSASQVPHRGVPRRCRRLDDLADRRVDRQRHRPAQRRRDPGPAAGERQRRRTASACTSLSTPGGAGGHVRAGREEDGERDQDDDGEGAPRASAPCDLGRRTDSQPVEVRLAVGPDDGQAGVAGEQVGGDRAHLLLVDGVQPGQHLAHRQVLAVGQLALAQPAHPRAGVLQAEHQAALELAAAAGHLLGVEPLGGHPGQLLAHQPQHLGHPLLRAPGVHREASRRPA